MDSAATATPEASVPDEDDDGNDDDDDDAEEVEDEDDKPLTSNATSVSGLLTLPADACI